MTTAPSQPRAGRLGASRAALVTERLECGFTGHGRDPLAVLAHQHLLDALDRGDVARFAVWPEDDPVGVAYLGANGTLVVSGDPAAGAPIAEYVEGGGWRVLIGDAPIAQGVLRASPRQRFRRGPNAREQRLMTCQSVPDHAPHPPPGWRRARARDLGAVTDLAALLHVEDRMGPPLSKSGRASVRGRMRDSIADGDTWVLERGGRIDAKVDVSLRSKLRGAQIAGVYVTRPVRGRGVASAGVAHVTRQLLDEGLPGVTLHVRSENPAARAAYRRAGYVDRAAWLLALR